MATITEDYKEKLKEALNSDNTDYEVVRWIEQNFPELKESKDELTWLTKFIQEEIDCIRFDIRDDEDRIKLKNLQKSFAWLEKQKSIKWENDDCATLENWMAYVEENKGRWELNDWFVEATKEVVNKIKHILSHNQELLDMWLSKENRESWLEKQGKQKETLCDKCKKEQPSHSCQDITALGRCALEKQGEHRQDTNYPKFDFNDVLSLQCCMETVKKVQEDKDLYEKLKDLHGRIYDAYHFEKQGEQKPINEDAEKEKIEYVSGQFLYCKGSFNEFKEGESYWLEYIGNDTYVGRSDNILNKKFRITPRQLYTWLDTRHFEHSKQGEQKISFSLPTEGEFPYNNPADTLDGEIENIWQKLSCDNKFTATKDGFHEVVVHFVNWYEKKGEQNLNPCDGCINRKGCINCENGELREVEQKPAESNDIKGILLVHDEILNNLLERYKTSATFKTLIVNLKNWWNNTRIHLLSFNIEQKSAWSEEDEKNLRVVVDYLIADNGLTLKHINWLKSIKDRVQPQPKWSEEDKKHIETISLILEDKKKEQTQWGVGVLDEEIAWLKSLHPQNHWKPTEEQMEALNSLLLKGEITEIGQAPCLQSLYYSLKAL